MQDDPLEAACFIWSLCGYYAQALLLALVHAAVMWYLKRRSPQGPEEVGGPAIVPVKGGVRARGYAAFVRLVVATCAPRACLQQH